MTINDQPDSTNVFGEVIESNNYVQPVSDQINSSSYEQPIFGKMALPRHLVITFQPDGSVALSTPSKLTIYEWKAAKGLVEGLLDSIDQHKYGGTK